MSSESSVLLVHGTEEYSFDKMERNAYAMFSAVPAMQMFISFGDRAIYGGGNPRRGAGSRRSVQVASVKARVAVDSASARTRSTLLTLAARWNFS